MESYLNSRKQYTKVDGVGCSLGNITYGIAQGFIVGLLIFMLYVNDIFKELDCNGIALMYADDMLLFSSGTTIEDKKKVENCLHVNAHVDNLCEKCLSKLGKLYMVNYK